MDLKFFGLYDNSIVVFSTDNGGDAWNSNLPLKGAKETVYEGGIRGVSFILSPLLRRSGYTNTEMMHLVDWLPTLVNMAGGKEPAGTDGVNQWDMISNNEKTARKEIVHNIDEDKHGRTFQVMSRQA